jgi:NAD(P)-dependent dehydrogenase (short-subunit alcohol dehydrogenase family)
MSQGMTGKVVVITGGAAGIGRASALAFAHEGAAVVVADIDDTKGEQTTALVRDGGGEASYIRADVTKSADVRALIQGVTARYGGLDYAFNNAGFVGSSAGIVETSEADWDQAVALNLTSVWLCMKYEIPEMLKRGGGAIVNNGSVAGLVGSPLIACSVATKHGVSGLSKSAALEYATRGIRVNAVAPGLIRTELAERLVSTLPAGAEEMFLSTVPQHRWGSPEEIAKVVVFLCSDAASHVTGHVLPVDGGMTAD